jgi:type IV pilus biogenesis protein CpaD/CtpE
MMRTTHNLSRTGIASLVALLLIGCTQWDPIAVEEDFGNSVRHMIQAQTYDPEARKNPPADPPTELDGQKASEILKTYRSDVGKAEEVKNAIDINVRNR